jgi:hypothetical protein
MLPKPLFAAQQNFCRTSLIVKSKERIPMDYLHAKSVALPMQRRSFDTPGRGSSVDTKVVVACAGRLKRHLPSHRCIPDTRRPGLVINRSITQNKIHLQAVNSCRGFENRQGPLMHGKNQRAYPGSLGAGR